MTYRKLFGGVVALLLAAAFAQPVSAQRAGNWYWNLKYSTVLPVGETADYADGFSWRGATFDFRRGMTDMVSLGLSAGWHVMNDKSSGTLVVDQGAVSGTAARYINSVPILAVSSVHFGDRRSTVRPFLGGGIGTYYVKNRTDVGLFAFEESHWHFGLMAEAGLAFPRPGGSGWTLGARFNWAAKADDVQREYFTFSVGYAVGN